MRKKLSQEVGRQCEPDPERRGKPRPRGLSLALRHLPSTPEGGAASIWLRPLDGVPSGRSSIMVSMNRLSTEKRAQIIGCLVEGNSIRATVRMTGAAKNTITKLLA